MTLTSSSITDIPRDVRLGEKDNFGITQYEQGLVEFISRANTPVTVALQGEWGSGKTSLMNSLQQTLAQRDNSPYHSVWLNTWEYALMKDTEETLMSIITGLIEEVSEIAKIEPTQTQKIVKKLWGVGKHTAKFATKQVAERVVSGSSQLVDAVLSDEGSESQSSISAVRNELEQVISDCIERDGKRGIIFFIDDLDRIDPPVAVQLLELLKNIFTINNCVFVLAIDYDVVIKGLEPKFGRFTEENEREFRSFFDKIIQVPFSMPVSSYSVDGFLKDNLATINYLTPEKCNDEALIGSFSKIAELSVGTNPRALKRLLNSLSLISCINQFKADDSTKVDNDLSLLLNFALVSIQIAYPKIYRLLNSYPAFDQWDDSVVLHMNLPELDTQSREKLAQSEAFDEEWEQTVFRVCESDFYLKKRSLYISNLLNLLREVIKAKNLPVEETIEAVISLSSVTNLEAFDTAPKKNRRGEDIGNIIDETEIVYENVTYRVVMRDSGQVQMFDKSTGDKVRARSILTKYMQGLKIDMDYKSINTRVIGKKLFDWLHSQG